MTFSSCTTAVLKALCTNKINASPCLGVDVAPFHSLCLSSFLLVVPCTLVLYFLTLYKGASIAIIDSALLYRNELPDSRQGLILLYDTSNNILVEGRQRYSNTAVLRVLYHTKYQVRMNNVGQNECAHKS